MRQKKVSTGKTNQQPKIHLPIFVDGAGRLLRGGKPMGCSQGPRWPKASRNASHHMFFIQILVVF